MIKSVLRLTRYRLRCDRQSPCSACVRRDKPSDCYYTSTEQERRDAVDYRPAHARGPQNRQRVARLEKMVTEMRDMMQHSVNNPKPEQAQTPANTLPQIPQAPLGPVDFHAGEAPNMGSLSLDDSNPIYVGNTHWSTILDDLQQLKDDLPDELSNSSGSPVPSQSDTGTQQEPAAARISLLNTGPCLPRDQILAMIPPRKVVDRLISQFFNSFDLASCKHYDDPQELASSLTLAFAVILSRSNFLSEVSAQLGSLRRSLIFVAVLQFLEQSWCSPDNVGWSSLQHDDHVCFAPAARRWCE